jgi:DNA invertase Pin-like site-specific DNA recombinase
MTSNGRPLIPYMRQSRAKERTISIEEQRRDIHTWAQAAGVNLASEIVEQNVSGSKPWRERALGEAVAACERGEAAGVIVAWQDRLSRENGRATAEVWEALEQAGARLVCAGEGLDTATGDHEMLFTIKAAIAREQWKRFRANWEGAKRNAAEQGVASGRAPMGYRKRKGKPFALDSRTGPKVREAFELRAQGVAFSAIARRLGWSHSTTRQLLANPAYTGVLIQGGFVKKNAHPAIVSRDLFDAVQASRTVQPVAPGENTRDLLLAGLARCAGCGNTLKVVRAPRAKGRYVVSYYCKNAATESCPERAYVHADQLDTLVDQWFTAAIKTVPRMVDVVAVGQELEQAQAVQATAEEQLRRYVDNAVIDDPVVFQRGVDARQGRVDQARELVGQLAARLPRLPVGGPLWTLWDGFDIARRRSILAAAIDRIVVRRGASADLEGSVKIFWKDGTLAFPDVADEERRVGMVAA